jgi:hypothetical protein
LAQHLDSVVNDADNGGGLPAGQIAAIRIKINYLTKKLPGLIQI